MKMMMMMMMMTGVFFPFKLYQAHIDAQMHIVTC